MAEFSPVFLALLLSESYSSACYHEASSQGFILIFLFFCSDKAQGNWDFPEERLTVVANNSFSQQHMFSDVHQYFYFHRCFDFAFWISLCPGIAYSWGPKSPCKTVNFHNYTSQTGHLWTKFLCALRQHYIAHHTIS